MKKRQKFDLHIHSSFSDGKLSVAEIVDLYGGRGFSAIAITDRLADSKSLNGLVAQKLKLSLTREIMSEYLETIRVESLRAKEKYNMLLIAGVEVTLNSWSRHKGAHIIFLNVDRYIEPDKSVLDLLKENREFFSIAAHPLWEESYEFKTTHLWDNRAELTEYFDAWECATGAKFSIEVYQSGLPIVASSDFHNMAQFESWKTQAYVDVVTVDKLFDEIRNRRVEPVWI